ncbi:hypothetical protein ASC61_14530 [Aeromicrobium sp. Root344]|uniref:hypothetical protein n=1 Tax=Aeromicrobium sp. Root344 TaxID=1736521 RepID=UPI000702138E|nr:hypothetical protein [Aeromicrobium sp. Root344]KQV76121.1 hypothetical protein ASC61_14530 [Aeromicrobium sp. Root344]
MTPSDIPDVHTPADLERVWRHLIEPLGFGSRQIFAIMLDRGGRVQPSIVNVTDCPAAPDGQMLVNLARSLRIVLDEGDPDGSIALLWARPTHAGTRASDIQWVRAITAVSAAHSLGAWPVHTADDSVLRVMSPDDLAA